ncbi:hypothetical protein [Yersinia similis]|uniref:hypothetical protein n=1 Tax=Yersinia similis TaxID=367190 RepID=UPI00384BA237
MMSGKKGFFALVLIILLAYLSAWLMVYQQSKRYFDFAEQQYAAGDYILALKGMNKIELYRHDVYSGGYQQVIDDWRHGMLVYRPDFYYQALARSSDLLARASDQQLAEFIATYTEIDTRFVAEAATCLLARYRQRDESANQRTMEEYLAEAFPAHALRTSSQLDAGCNTDS